jgi:hypothetical protein
MTTTTINGLNNVPVKISASLIGTTSEFMGQPTYKHRVTVSTEGNRASFVYHTSINDYNQGKDEMDERDLIFALDCFISDAIAGEMDLYNFCNEFGYDYDSRKAGKVWRACQRATGKANRLFPDLYDMANHVRETQNV